MLSMQLLCVSKQTPFSLSGKPNPLAFKQHSHHIFKKRISSSSSSCYVVHAVKEDSQQYEVDPDKAREALQNLDQELQSLSKKQVPSPKIRATDVKITKQRGTETAEELELSGSFLAYSAVVLFLFTIVYNVFFYTVIRPSVDGS